VINLVGLPAWAEGALALLLLDYTLYVWHVLTHRVPLLWRFHVVHHGDLDMDASTALRFHFGELIISVVASGTNPPHRCVTALPGSVSFERRMTRSPRLPERLIRVASISNFLAISLYLSQNSALL